MSDKRLSRRDLFGLGGRRKPAPGRFSLADFYERRAREGSGDGARPDGVRMRPGLEALGSEGTTVGVPGLPGRGR